MNSLLTLLIFVALPFCVALFLLWRAYQLAVRGRVELTRQGLPMSAPGIEAFARLFAWRDVILAFACFVYLGLLFSMPSDYAAWVKVLVAFGFVHQGITYYAVYRVSKKRGA